jgi:hypothetical protein
MEPGSAILWIHGPQPVLLSSGERLAQFFERTDPGQRPLFYELPVTPGPNLVSEKLATHIRIVPAAGSLRERIQRLANAPFAARREKTGAVEPSTGAQHIVRLWAKEQTERLLAARQPEAAVALAIAHHLVTPLTGAVVLETTEQYKRHDLKPADPASTPEVGVVPEPAAWMLVTMGLLVLVFGVRRQRAKFTSA